MANIGEKLGKLGGPLLGGAGRAVDKAVEKPAKAGANASENLGKWIQGKAANQATKGTDKPQI